MDAQIALNAEGVDNFNKQMVVDELEKLNLSTDGQYIILSLGDVVLAEVAVADVNDVTPCTDLALTSSSSLAIDVGETSGITCTTQPSDCTQVVRYRSTDLGVASVNSKGVVTGVGCGTCDINVLCGNHSEIVKAKVSEIFKPTWTIGHYVYTEDKTDKNGNPAAALELTSTTRAYVFPQEGTKDVFIPAGHTITIQYNGSSNYYFMHVVAVTPLDAKGFLYTEDWSSRPCCANIRVVGYPTGNMSSYKGVLTYTAPEDCYLIFGFRSEDIADPTSGYTEEDIEALNNGLLTIRVSPA